MQYSGVTSLSVQTCDSRSMLHHCCCCWDIFFRFLNGLWVFTLKSYITTSCCSMHLTSPDSLQMQLDVEKIIFKIIIITITTNYVFCLLLTNTSGFLLDKKYTIQFYWKHFFFFQKLQPKLSDLPPSWGSQRVEWHLKVPHAVIRLKVTYLHYQVTLTSQTKTAESSHDRWTSLKIDKAQMSSTAATLHFFYNPQRQIAQHTSRARQPLSMSQSGNEATYRLLMYNGLETVKGPTVQRLVNTLDLQSNLENKISVL